MDYLNTCRTLTKVFLKLCNLLSLTDHEIKNILQINNIYLVGLRLERDIILYDTKRGQRALNFILVYIALNKFLSHDLNKVIDWLTNYNKEFNTVPLLYIQSKKNNMKKVIKYLNKISQY